MDSPLLLRWSRAMAHAGIDTVSLLAGASEEDGFGNGKATFSLGTLVLHFLCDRGQEFLDVAPMHAPTEHFRLDYIGLALGWRRVEETMDRTEPRALADELTDVVRYRDELEKALSFSSLAATRAATECAVAERERAFLDKLQRLADQSR
jgi:hypothetical protein